MTRQWLLWWTNEGIPRLLWWLKIHDRVHKSASLYPLSYFHIHYLSPINSEDGRNVVRRNVGFLLHYAMASKPRIFTAVETSNTRQIIFFLNFLTSSCEPVITKLFSSFGLLGLWYQGGCGDGVCTIYRRNEKFIKILVLIPEGKRPFGKFRRIW